MNKKYKKDDVDKFIEEKGFLFFTLLVIISPFIIYGYLFHQAMKSIVKEMKKK